MATAIEAVLWPGLKAIVGDDLVLSGIHVNKGGYHSDRDWLRRNDPSDYSIQLDIDKLGPSDEGSAIDTTFKSAQRGDYRNIAKYSKLLYEAGVHKDPRTYPLREFQGNIDLDGQVEGWSYYRGWALTGGDPSHLFHIHQSIWRKYIDDEAAMRSILSIWKGEDMPLSESDLDKIEARLMKPANLNKIADAVLKRDGAIENNFTDNVENTHVSAATALSVLGERTK